MIRLIKIEWRKLKNSTAFYLFSLFYIIALLGVSSAAGSIDLNLGNIKTNTGDFGVFDFPSIWQVVTYISSWFKIILAIIFITFITNEFQYRTLRQNIIDGLSKKEFIASKIIMLVILSAISTLLVLGIVLVLGFAHSSFLDADIVIMKSYFILAYFLKLVAFFSLIMLIAFITKKTGFAIVTFFVIFVIENVLKYKIFPDFFPEELSDYAVNFLPLEAMGNLIHEPFTKLTNANELIGNQVYDSVYIRDVLVTLAYTLLFMFGSYKIIEKRDL